MNADNQEYSRAAAEVKRKIRQLAHPDVDMFMTHFVECYQLTLEGLLIQHHKLLPDKKQQQC